jgi:hypothetical protein
MRSYKYLIIGSGMAPACLIGEELSKMGCQVIGVVG